MRPNSLCATRSSVPAGNGVYGQESRTVAFSVGDANVYKVDAASHQ